MSKRNMIVKPNVYVTGENATLPIKLVAQPIQIQPTTSTETLDVSYQVEPQVYVEPITINPVLIEDDYEDEPAVDEDYDDGAEDEVILLRSNNSNRTLRNNYNLGGKSTRPINCNRGKRYVLANNSNVLTTGNRTVLNGRTRGNMYANGQTYITTTGTRLRNGGRSTDGMVRSNDGIVRSTDGKRYIIKKKKM